MRGVYPQILPGEGLRLGCHCGNIGDMNATATTTTAARHLADLEHQVAAHTEGLASYYEAATDTLIITWAGISNAPSTAVLRASTATEHDVREAILRFIYA